MEENKVLCPGCGAEMERKLENFSIGADGGGGLMTLLAVTYDVDLYACPRCGKVELYTAGFRNQQEEPEPDVVCPDCGTKHSPLIGCPACALQRAQTGGFYQNSKKKKDRRPPWEK